MKRATVVAVVLAGVLAVASGPLSAQVKVWQGSVTLPTYEEGKPDPNPPFDTYATTQFNYPYTLRKELTGQKEDHVWRAVFLENKYLKCTVLPDIGGHLYTCIDKISGQPMFYANPSIKKAKIGYRGAWAAFGIEFNFPVSHNWVSMSPVDFAYATHPDGSASVTVGNIDRVYGMQWGVELVLQPDSTLLEERVTLYNRERRAPPLLLVEQRGHPGVGRLAYRISDAVCGLPWFHRSDSLAHRCRRQGPQHYQESHGRPRVDVCAWKS